MNAPQPPRCALARIIAEPMDKVAVKRQGWRDLRILVVSADDNDLRPLERQAVIQIARRLYGDEREPNGGKGSYGAK